ncbi:MAG: RluA family pseudouridine synthase [Flavobacteriales bacterium]
MKKNPTKSQKGYHSQSSKPKKDWKKKPERIEMTTVDSLRVLFEDNHLIAINKRPSDIIQSDKTEDKILSEITAEYLAKKYDKPGKAFIAIIHRIDRPVSGVILYAKTTKAAKRMVQLFKDREMKKTYWAIVENAPPQQEATVVNYLKKNQDRNKSYVHQTEVKGSKRSELSYKHLGAGDRYHFLEVRPKTGRHHQIRTTLSNIGCPIKGDVKYMAKRTNKDASVCLHARSLEFIHPVKKEPVSIIAPPPEDVLWGAFINAVGQ